MNATKFCLRRSVTYPVKCTGQIKSFETKMSSLTQSTASQQQGCLKGLLVTTKCFIYNSSLVNISQISNVDRYLVIMK